MLRVTSLLGLGLIMWLFKRLAEGGSPEAQATMALGFLLLAAYLGGRLAADIKLPRITGYLLVGLAAGPVALHVVTAQDVGNLRLIDEIAVALIALAAGGELKVPVLREHGRGLVRLGARMAGFPMAIVALAVVVASPWFPLTAGRGAGDVAAVALLLGLLAAVGSPAVVMAVLSETGAKGPLARSVLTVVVALDVLLIVAFAGALNVARALAGDGAFDPAFAAGVLGHVLASVLGGLVLGWLVSQYLQHVQRDMVLFMIGVAFLAVELSHLLALDAMLLTLTAGFFVENLSPARGELFVQSIERSGLPIYAVFFALAGAGVHPGDLTAVWPWVVGLVALRAGSLMWASRGSSEPAVRRYGWTGFLPQAGVALGLAVVVSRTFPSWGPGLQSLVVATIAVQQLVGPIFFRWGLVRADEVGAEAAGT